MSTSVRKCDKCGYTTLNSTICHQCGNKLGFFADYMHADDLAVKMADTPAKPRVNKYPHIGALCVDCGTDSCGDCGTTKLACSGFTQGPAAVPAAVPTGIEAAVCEDIASRQQLGILKYGQTVAENPLDLLQWLQHAYEECLDQAVYLKRAIAEMKAKTYMHGRMEKDGTQANS